MKEGNCRFSGICSHVTRRVILAAAVLAVILARGALSESSPQVAVPPDCFDQPQTVRNAYELLRDGAYNNERLGRLASLYERANQLLQEAALPSQEDALWRSRIEYMLARGYQAQSNPGKARAHFDQGLGFAEAALKLGPSSEAWRMRAEHVSQLCLLKGAGFLLSNGPKAITFAEKALQLDSRNAAALIILAHSKIYPPPLFGGNPAAGIRLMLQAMALESAERDDLFNIYSGIGLACEKLKDSSAAREWVLKALALYPTNAFALKQYSRVH